MPLKLYGSWCCPFSNIAAFTLHEKRADFELVVVDYTIIKSEEYLSTKNPFGKAPALEDEDLVVCESRAIARYVAAKFEGQGTPLMGSTLKEQALVNVWVEVESQTFFPVVYALSVELRCKIQPDAAVIESNMEKLGKILDVYEAQLSKHKYLAGDFFSLADLFHIPMLHFFWHAADVQRAVITSRPHVRAWYEETVARPAWQKILQIPTASDWSHIQKV